LELGYTPELRELWDQMPVADTTNLREQDP